MRRTSIIATFLGFSIIAASMAGWPTAIADAADAGAAAATSAATPSDAGQADSSAAPSAPPAAAPPPIPAVPSALAPGAGATPATPTPATASAAPSDDGQGWVDQMVALWRSGAGIPLAIMLLFGIAKFLTKHVPWLAKGANAAYSAAAVAFLGTLSDACARGQVPTMQVIVSAGFSAWLLLAHSGRPARNDAAATTGAAPAEPAPNAAPISAPSAPAEPEIAADDATATTADADRKVTAPDPGRGDP